METWSGESKRCHGQRGRDRPLANENLVRKASNDAEVSEKSVRKVGMFQLQYVLRGRTTRGPGKMIVLVLSISYWLLASASGLDYRTQSPDSKMKIPVMR